MGTDPGNITKWVMIFIFIKNLCNRDIRSWIAGAKRINTLADTFTLAHQSLLKWKKYERLIYNNECEVAEINQITNTSKHKMGVIVFTPDEEVY